MTSKPIPGTYEVKGRQFMYVESPENETFHQFVDLGLKIPDLAMPRSGGAIEEKVRIGLPGDVSLMGISYKGDIDGWRKRFVGICETAGRRFGFVENERLSLSDGSSSLLEDLEIRFEK